MASSRDADEFVRRLHCPSCKCAFDLDGRKPRFLRCHHSVCEFCLKSTLKKMSEVMCKECDVLTQAASPKVEGFPVNHYLMSIIPLFVDDDDGHVQLNRSYVRKILKSLSDPTDDPTSTSAEGGRGVPELSSATFAHPSSSSPHASGAVFVRENPFPNFSGICVTDPPHRSREVDSDDAPRRRQKSSDRGSSSSAHRSNADTDSSAINPLLSRFAQLTKLRKREADDTCVICVDKLTLPSEYDDPGVSKLSVVRLPCGHMFHHNCIIRMVKNKENFLRCPSCNVVHGTRIGNQPVGGKMIIQFRKASAYSMPPSFSGYLPGFEKDSHGIFEISYDLPTFGIQGPEHPNPGNPFFGDFPRHAFLPASIRGLEVLCMLKVAFDRRLIFTIGTSATTNIPNSIIWAGIHHKTSTRPGPYGYPDPNYLDNVTQELAAVGITPADIPADLNEKEQFLGIKLS